MHHRLNAYGNSRPDLHEELLELIEDLETHVNNITYDLLAGIPPSKKQYKEADRVLELCKRVMRPDGVESPPIDVSICQPS